MTYIDRKKVAIPIITFRPPSHPLSSALTYGARRTSPALIEATEAPVRKVYPARLSDDDRIVRGRRTTTH